MRNYFKGAVLMAMALLSWVFSILSTNLALGDNFEEENSYQKPFMIQYIEGSSLVVCLVPTLIRYF